MENIYIQKDRIASAQNRTYKMIPTRGMVIFPGQVTHIDIARDKTMSAIQRVLETGEELFLVAQKSAQNTNPSPKDIYRVGTLAKVTQTIRLAGDHMRCQVVGLCRMEIDAYVQLQPHFVVELMPFFTEKDDEIMLEAIKRNLISGLESFRHIDARVSLEVINTLKENEFEKFIAYMSSIIYRTDASKQNLLQQKSVYLQLEDVLTQMSKEGEIAIVEKRIATAVRAAIDKNQREFYLREQIKAIRSELGEDEDEAENYRKQLKEKKVSDESAQKIEKEILRLEKMNPTSPESGVIRTYIEWLLDLPWHEESEDNFDLANAREVLDEDHYGLEKVKERILEFLAVHQLTKNHKAPILCFVGPPGVGKTSIVSSIARAAGKKLVSMSLGGIRDEAEIRGHRRTYIGSMPGRIISAMKNAEVVNPVFLLDEIDKMSSDFRGDPAAAMLEVLDPNQNFNFKDHYIEVPYDLSKVTFVMTANTIDSISPPLLDRMEVIKLSGYTFAEKLQIARKYLVKKQLKLSGLDEKKIEITDAAINKIIHSYTRESGVRNLEREIGSVARKLAVKVLEEGEKKTTVKVGDIVKLLGPERFLEDEMLKEDSVGLATGLAWTAAGGCSLNIEVALIKGGKGEIILTGSLGEVMKESCHAALSLIKARMDKYGIDGDIFNTHNIHIHFPEGATPKDGPSAGITVATAILSALVDKKVKSNVAMTGEITLRGKVLAIGGLKEKSLAAYRLGIKTLIIPEENKKDLKEIPKEVTDAVNIVIAGDIDTVFDNAIIMQ